MNLAWIETMIQWTGGLLAYTTLGVILYGIWRGSQRQAGRVVGSNPGWLRSAWFYLACTAFFFGVCVVAWKPLPLIAPPILRFGILALGSLLLFPGLLFALWGRLALGKNYFVSTGFGAQLFADHQLVTHGPYAIVRHPMYTGICLAALGSLLTYYTWTTLLFVCFAPLLAVRARREEAVLAAEFGEPWVEYCRRVPAFFPRRR